MSRTPTARRLRSIFAVSFLAATLILSIAALRPTGGGAQAPTSYYDAIELQLVAGGGAQAMFFNRAGHVLGIAPSADGPYHTFVYNDTGIHDLEAAVGPSAEVSINEPHKSMSEEGSVLFNATDDATPSQNAFVFDDTGAHRITLGTGTFSVAIDINDAGQATGASTIDADDNSILHAFRYDHGTLTDLGTLGGSRSYPLAISENGKVAGESTNADGATRAFLYDDTGIHDLGVLPGGTMSYAFAVNDAGQVAGFSDAEGGGQRAFLHDGTTMIDLGVLPGGTYSNATHINAAGHVVGRADAPNLEQHIFLHDGTQMIDLTPGAVRAEVLRFTDNGVVIGKAYTTPNTGHGWVFVYDETGLHTISFGGSVSDANGSFGGNGATNRNGDVAGMAYLAGDSVQQPFLYTRADGLRNLNPDPADFGEALGINDAGHVVGTLNGNAFLWRGGVMTNLNFFTSLGGSLRTAYGISDDGKILAADTEDGHLYLLTPGAPPPTTADVIVGATLDEYYVPTGGQITYTIYVNNQGPAMAADATLTSQLPAGVTVAAIEDDGGGSCSAAPDGTGFTCTFSSINLFENKIVRVTATSAVAGAPYTPVVAGFTVATSTPGDNPDNNNAAVEFLIASPPLPSPTPGPANEDQLAYIKASPSATPTNIFRQRADGAGLLNLTNEPARYGEFFWSPDGSKIAFGRYDSADDNTNLYVMDADGTNQIRLTNNPSEQNFGIAWSPDGTRIAFNAYDRTTDTISIHTVNVDGSDRHALTSSTERDGQPAWSPDGSRISFVRTLYDFQTNNFTASIYVMNADGTNQIEFANTGVEIDYNPAWSPDSAQIAWARFPNDGLHGPDLFVAQADGTNMQNLTNDYSVSFDAPAWSPDGSKLAFLSAPNNGPAAVSVINADGSGRTTVSGSVENISFNKGWSPDGSKLAFTVAYGEVYNGIYVVNADGTGLTHIGEDIEHNSEPVWSPDGSKLAFYSFRNGQNSIDLINIDGTGRVELTRDASLPKWRPRSPANTPAGTNVTVAEDGVQLTFSNVATAGQTTVTPIDPNSLQGIPGEYVINANSLAFEITTTAAYTGPITIGFQVPSVNNPITFSALRVLHGEPPPVPNFVDRTILAPDSPTHDFPTRTVYARVTSLSPFVIAERASQDTTPPDIQITSPTASVYTIGQTLTASFNCTDSGSGVVSCTGTSANGSPVNTATVGAKTFTVNAADAAGIPASKQVSYTVAYGIRPMHDQNRVHKSGSTVHLELQLINANGVNLSSAGVVVTALNVTRVSANAGGLVEEYNDDDPDSDFTFQSGQNLYRFKLKTRGYAAGTYLISFRAGSDPTIHTVEFRIRQ